MRNILITLPLLFLTGCDPAPVDTVDTSQEA